MNNSFQNREAWTKNAHKYRQCCKKHNKMNNKIEQGKIRVFVVKNTSIKMNKTIAFFRKICYYKDSRDD